MTLSFPTLFSALRAVAGISHAVYWGDCPHCERPTPWQANALRGEYRCTRCGRSPLEGEPASSRLP